MKFGKIGLTCTALFLLSAVSLTAFAQGAGQAGAGAPGGGGRQGGGRQRGQRGGLVTIPVSTLNTYLKLTTEQKEKITSIQTQFKEDAKSFAPVPGAQVDQQAAQEMRTKSRAASTKAEADIKALLTEEQTKMIDAMNKDIQAFGMVGIPVEVLPDLKLTASERMQIAAIADESQKTQMAKMQEFQQNGGGDRQAMTQAMQDMRKATHDKVMDILTIPQKTRLEAYLKDHPQPQGGRGGFGGGGRRGGAGAGAPPGGAPPRN